MVPFTSKVIVIIIIIITSVKEVMFSSAFVCFVWLRKNYSIDFHKFRRKGGTWTTEDTVRFWW